MNPTTSLDRNRLAARVDALRPEFARILKNLVEIPSVSRAERAQGRHRSLRRRRGRLVRAAGGTAEVVDDQGQPVVVGTIGDPAKIRPSSIYNHMDVQPAAEGKDGWTRAPFVFAEEAGRWYGRGSTDDKGPGVTAFLAATLAREEGIPLAVRFVWEFEEEIGSPSFEGFLAQHGAALKPASVLVSDTIWLAAGKPAVPYGLRGLAGALLKLRTAKKDAHSGLCGGAARNPVAELADVVSKCVDARTGEILIEGFEKTWSPVTAEEARDFVDSGFSIASYKAAHQLEKLRSEDPAEVTQRIWAVPRSRCTASPAATRTRGSRPSCRRMPKRRCRCAWCRRRIPRSARRCWPRT